MADTSREIVIRKDGTVEPVGSPSPLYPQRESTPKDIKKTNKQRTLKILVAFQVEDETSEVEYVETSAQFFHNGTAYVVSGGGLPYAEHYNLAQAALDWLRIALLQFGSDFMKKKR